MSLPGAIRGVENVDHTAVLGGRPYRDELRTQGLDRLELIRVPQRGDEQC